jgi:hypothetical protein
MRRLWTLLLSATSAALPSMAGAQAAADTLPERVVDRAYDAINRCDVQAYGSLFASVWYHSMMEDSTQAAKKLTRDQLIRDVSQWCKPPKPRFKMLHRVVLGPYVLDEQAVLDKGTAHLDIFEVRNGKIAHEWESDFHQPGASSRP